MRLLNKFLFNKLVVIPMILLLTTVSAHAGTGAQATIHSSAKLTYNGGSAYDSATVKVKLVAAPVDIRVDETTISVDAGNNAQFTFTFASNANGKEVYTLSTDSIVNEGVDVPTVSFAGGTQLTLGASITSAPMDTTNVLKIPAGTANMFDDNDIIRLSDGNANYPGTYRITSRVEGTVATTNANGDTLPESPALITVVPVSGGALNNVPAGVQIGEVKDVQVTITSGTVNGGAATPEHVINFSVTSKTDPDSVATTSSNNNNEVVVVVSVPSTLEFVKEVKLASAGDETYVSYLEANPSEVLTYRITVSNNSGATVTGANVTDVIPNFTKYVDDSLKLNGASWTGDLPWSTNGMTVKSTNAVNDGDILAGEVAIISYNVVIN
ncbi:hypothetical protein [Thalassotalea aquiviva]|uniref:hypothetical protein n=1 Tax=Thalassotalea aquiviva TaxID=3242415 RepID=UPI00352A930B